jgi:hypothetical protein
MGKEVTQMTQNTKERGRFGGWDDFLGSRSRWDREALLNFLEDLRPYLKDLKETELHIILQQEGAMPALKKVLPENGSIGVIRDLKDNDAKEIQEGLDHTSDSELQDAPFEVDKNGVLHDHTPEDEELEDDSDGDLTDLATPDGLRVVDKLSQLRYGPDDEVAEFLVLCRVAALRQIAFEDSPASALDALQGDGGTYFQRIRDRFLAEYNGANEPVPAGWSFPEEPNLMQRWTAYMLSKRKRLGNWSGVGTGKTLSAILASRVAQRRHTLVICNNSTVEGWAREIRKTFPDSVIRTSVHAPMAEKNLYTVLNYEKFQQHYRRELMEKLVEQAPDFVVLDEGQFVKQRDKDESARRQAIAALLSELGERNPDLHVLGMSATPVINSLVEPRRLMELVMGREFKDLSTTPTVTNALAMHRTLKIHGLRLQPDYDKESPPDTPTVVRNDLLDDLREGEGVLHMEQTLLPAKLDLVRADIKPGTLIYTHYVDGMVQPIREFVEGMGLTCGLYTGSDKSGLEPFLKGRVDVLIGSQPVGTGLDGLQYRSNQLIMMSLPWTSAEYQQIVGRIRRQGSVFDRVRIVVPLVTLDHHGDTWSWDERRMDTIRFKRTLSDCAVDGHIPEVAKISPKELEQRGRVALEKWIERVEGGDTLMGVERDKLRIPLPPALTEKLQRKHGEFTEMNRRWGSSNSSTVHSRLKEDPQEWYLYHSLYRKARQSWTEVPAFRIARELQARPDLRVGDFGAGECLLRDALPDHDVVSLDHVGVDESVIKCDMAHTPLQDGKLGAAVFSLSLMGRNWQDYLTEAYRTLQPLGLLFIAEPSRKWEDPTPLEEAARTAGFQMMTATTRNGFLYLRGMKLQHQV